MNTIRVIGIDIAKSVFQVYVWMADDFVAWNRKISRQELLDILYSCLSANTTLWLFQLSSTAILVTFSRATSSPGVAPK